MKGKQRSEKNRNDTFSEERDSFSSAENLDEYIRVSKPGTKVVLAALLVVLAAVIVWGIIGKLPVTESVKGLVVNRNVEEKYYETKGMKAKTQIPSGKNLIYCFVDASRFKVIQIREFGEKATIEMPDHKRMTGTIKGQLEIPLSSQECKELLFDNEWVTERCVKTDYSWWLIIEPDCDVTDYEFMLADVTIVTEEVAPISFISG